MRSTVLFFCLLSCCLTIKAQSDAWWQKPYVFLHGGGIYPVFGQQGLHLFGGMGYQFHDWAGLGISYGTTSNIHHYLTFVTGTGIHYQITPKTYLIRLTVGNLSDWDRASSSSWVDSLANPWNPFIHLTCGWRPVPCLEIGLTSTATAMLDIDTYLQGDPSVPPTKRERRFWTVQPYLGIILPGRWRRGGGLLK